MNRCHVITGDKSAVALCVLRRADIYIACKLTCVEAVSVPPASFVPRRSAPETTYLHRSAMLPTSGPDPFTFPWSRLGIPGVGLYQRRGYEVSVRAGQYRDRRSLQD